MNSKKPSSCTECHLSGVELNDFVRSDQAETFAALRKQGFIDLKNPDESKILKFIARKPDKPSPITAKVRQKELAAFRAWIRAAVKDQGLLKSTAGKDAVGIKLPPEVIRHARKDRVLSSFVDNIWSQMGRCISCHSPDRNQRIVKKHGEQVSWIVPRNPAATLEKLLEGGNIDLVKPEQSPVLLKPAARIDHGGGPKFLVGGPAWHNFLTFLKDYAAIRSGKYKQAKDVPRPAQEIILPTRQHLRIVGLPERFHRVPLQVNLYRWDRKNRRWSKDRWGTAFNPIAGKRRLWQSIVNVVAPTGSPRAREVRHARRLPSGAYLAKLYIDQDRKTQQDPDYKLGEKEFVGQVEITGEWRPGYRPPKIIKAPRLPPR